MKENKEKLETIVNEITPIVDGMVRKSRIRIYKSEIDKYGTMTITFAGGTNGGDGQWFEYFKDLSDVLKEINDKTNYHTWAIKLINDCPDDVFDLTIGIREKKSYE